MLVKIFLLEKRLRQETSETKITSTGRIVQHVHMKYLKQEE